MNYPKVSQYLRQERAGVTAVAKAVNDLGLIWRETERDDVGIDGQIEFVDDAGYATGRLLAVQVKSGQSYFRDHGSTWHFYPDAKHRSYWEAFPLPVIVALHLPEEGKTYWADARLALRSPERGDRSYIAIPKTNVLEIATADALFSSTGASSRPFLSLEEVLKTMATTHTGNESFPITYLDLFANGLTNIVRSVYYGVDLAIEVANALFEPPEGVSHENIGVGMGMQEGDFLFEYIRFLVAQNLAHVEISDCLIDWHDRHMHPAFIAPLTSRGRALVKMISLAQNALEADGQLVNPAKIRVAQEGLVQMYYPPSHYKRMPIIREFRNLIASGSGPSA